MSENKSLPFSYAYLQRRFNVSFNTAVDIRKWQEEYDNCPEVPVEEIDKAMQHILYTFIWKKKDVFILKDMQWHELRYELATHIAEALAKEFRFTRKTGGDPGLTP